MTHWFISPSNTLWAIFLSSIGIYIALITFTRIAGKRSFSKMSSFDFAMTVAVGSLISTTVLSASTSLLQGVIGLASLYVIQTSVAILRKYNFIKKLVDNRPLLLMKGSKILYENLKSARISEGDLRNKLREANVLSLENVKAVVFETTGDVSVIHSNDPSQHIDPYLLNDVQE